MALLLSFLQYSVEGSTDEDTLDYGILSKHDTSSKLFTVHNVNPVEVGTLPVLRLNILHPIILLIGNCCFLSLFFNSAFVLISSSMIEKVL